MSGTWEGLIKPLKGALKVVIQERFFTGEILATLMCEVESKLNYNPGHNILELCNIVVPIRFTACKRKLDTWYLVQEI